MAIGFYSDKGVIYANYRKQRNGKKVNLKYYPGISDEFWDQSKGKFKTEELSKLKVKIEKAINDVIDSTDPFSLTNETFSQKIYSELYPGKSTKQTSFFKYADEFIITAKEEKGHEFANSFRTIYNKLQEFNPSLNFEDINMKFYRDFIKHLQKQEYSKNYIGSMIRDLKRILNRASDDKINSNLEYDNFDTLAEDVFNIYLNEQEIEAIYNLELTDEQIISLQKENGEEGDKEPFISQSNIKRQREALDRARKLIVIGCWTGLRVENYLAIDPDIQVDLKEGFIHAIANKNGPKLKIPIHRLVRQIIENDGFPRQISEQKLNKQIKVLGKLAEITENIIYSKTIGGRRKEFSKLKYEMITSHTARRSFASNLLVKGIPKQYIMSVTGHTTEKSFNKYTQAVQKDMMSAKLKDYDVWD